MNRKNLIINLHVTAFFVLLFAACEFDRAEQEAPEPDNIAMLVLDSLSTEDGLTSVLKDSSVPRPTFTHRQISTTLPSVSVNISEKVEVKASAIVPPNHLSIASLKVFTMPSLVVDSLNSENVLLNNRCDTISKPLYPVLNSKPILYFGLDNDFWNMTDYYYTNGVYVAFQHSVWAASPIAKLLVKAPDKGSETYGLVLVQNMYTGLKTKVDSIIFGDRPWASYSLLGQYLLARDRHHKCSHFSQLSVGVLGQQSGGDFLQTLAHKLIPSNSPPQGWQHQIAADIIVDYQYKLSCLLYESKNIESYAFGGGQIGSLRDNVFWGLGATYGRFQSFYKGNYTDLDRHRLHANVHFEVHTQLQVYDATLQGGMFNKQSPYILIDEQMQRFVVQAKLGIAFTYATWQLSIEQFWRSKTFTSGKDHKYLRIRIAVPL